MPSNFSPTMFVEEEPEDFCEMCHTEPGQMHGVMEPAQRLGPNVYHKH